MADAVETRLIADGRRNYVVNLSNISDGTGESAVIKVNASDLVGPDGKNAPSYFAIEEISWDIQGFTSVRILFDATADEVAAVLTPGQGTRKYPGLLNDPLASGTTGDILLTTAGATAGDSYDITLKLIKKQ